MLVSKDPLMYPLIRYLSRYCPPEAANAILARTMYLRDSPELSIPLRKADCASKTRAAPTAEPRKSDRGISLCLANIRTTSGHEGPRSAAAKLLLRGRLDALIPHHLPCLYRHQPISALQVIAPVADNEDGCPLRTHLPEKSKRPRQILEIQGLCSLI